MKAPAQLAALSLADDSGESSVAYPSLGFVRLLDAELGNGDYYGLYWPYGREDREPVVVDTVHDEWGLEVAFSSVPIFVEWLRANDGERGEVEVEDRALVTTRFERARALQRARPEAAIEQLRSICDDFPECSEHWYALAGQLRRVGDKSGAYAAAIRAFASNWAFGAPPGGTLRMLQSARGEVDDPVVTRSGELSLGYGGAKENSNYALLRECIDEYLASANPVLGLLLSQDYGTMMSKETGAFQERHGFGLDAWAAEHTKLCTEHLGDSRRRVEETR
ncbi:MAG: tetratricopeptide repeat-containing protein [Myxococcota bacterium]